MVWREQARSPDGMRLYTIGDTHGCRESLQQMFARIEDDLAARPAADWRIVLLGDLIDRGPDSAGLVDDMVRRTADDARVLSVLGNHDAYLLNFLSEPLTDSLEGWASYGGPETIRSYGIDPTRLTPEMTAEARHALQDDLVAAVPSAHRQWLDALPSTLVFGDYLLVHAGIRPGVPLASQDETDLIWIREPFLSDDTEHEHIVIHGHTPVDAVQVRRNRIGIDTGHVWGGPLTCLVLDNNQQSLLQADGLAPLG